MMMESDLRHSSSFAALIYEATSALLNNLTAHQADLIREKEIFYRTQQEVSPLATSINLVPTSHHIRGTKL